MGTESIAHEAEIGMGYSLRGHEGESKITTLHVHRLLLYISLPSLRDYDVKLPDFSNLFPALNSYSSSPNGLLTQRP